jgi:hypothetical protein
MKPEKEFDCVEMKVKIQERLLHEVEEFGEEETHRRRAERLSKDPILGTFLPAKLANSEAPAGHAPAA